MGVSAAQIGVFAALGSLASRLPLTAPAGVEGVAVHVPLEWVASHEAGAEGESFPSESESLPPLALLDNYVCIM